MLQHPLPSTLHELIALAIALEGEAASRFQAYAEYLRASGHEELASAFASLEAIEREHVKALKRCLEHSPPEHQAGGAPRGQLAAPEIPRNVCEALTLALAAERRAEVYYRDVAAHASSPLVRGMAADLAAGEQRHVRVVERLLAQAACA